jgi:hypothetical protein
MAPPAPCGIGPLSSIHVVPPSKEMRSSGGLISDLSHPMWPTSNSRGRGRLVIILLRMVRQFRALTSAIGTKRTSNCRLPMSAFGGKADIAQPPRMSAFDPKRTWVTSRDVLVATTHNKDPSHCRAARSKISWRKILLGRPATCRFPSDKTSCSEQSPIWNCTAITILRSMPSIARSMRPCATSCNRQHRVGGVGRPRR